MSNVEEYSGLLAAVWKGESVWRGCERLWHRNIEDLIGACLFCIADEEHEGFGGDSGCNKVCAATRYFYGCQGALYVFSCRKKEFLV